MRTGTISLFTLKTKMAAASKFYRAHVRHVSRMKEVYNLSRGFMLREHYVRELMILLKVEAGHRFEYGTNDEVGAARHRIQKMQAKYPWLLEAGSNDIYIERLAPGDLALRINLCNAAAKKIT